jgi:hypothetical protein
VARTEGSGAWWRGHRSTEARRWGTTERGEHKELGSGLTGAQVVAWRPGDGGEMKEERKLDNSSARASEEGESEMGEVQRSTGVRRPIYRAGGRSTEAVNSVTAGGGN